MIQTADNLIGRKKLFFRLREGQRDLAEVVFERSHRESQFLADPEHFSIVRQHDSIKLVKAPFLCNTDQHIDQFIPDAFPLVVIMDDHPEFTALCIGVDHEADDADNFLGEFSLISAMISATTVISRL